MDYGLYENILDFWEREEYFNPADYPIKKSSIYNVFYNESDSKKLPLVDYKKYNKDHPNKEHFKCANIYCGGYKIKEFVQKMADECDLDRDKYSQRINELHGSFCLFYIQIDLVGSLEKDGVKISPFFYAVIEMIKSKSVNVKIEPKDIEQKAKKINNIINDSFIKITTLENVQAIQKIVFEQLEVDEDKIELTRYNSTKSFLCQGLKDTEQSINFQNFYIDEIKLLKNHYKENEQVTEYIGSLLKSNENSLKKVKIDDDIESMKKWLDAEKFPLAKYPSAYSPNLMQQIAINIAISENDRNKDIFSINGPPGTGKTTLLKEIVASNVERLAEELINYGIKNDAFKKRELKTYISGSAVYYYEIPKKIAKYGILVASNNNVAVENITLDLPKADGMENTLTGKFNKEECDEIYFTETATRLLEQESWGLISAPMGRGDQRKKVLDNCSFDETNNNSLDQAVCPSWEQAVNDFEKAKDEVLKLRNEIKSDQNILVNYYKTQDEIDKYQSELNDLSKKRSELEDKYRQAKENLALNEKHSQDNLREIKYLKKQASFINKLLIFIRVGTIGKQISALKKKRNNLILEHIKMADCLVDVECKLQECSESIKKKEASLSEINKSFNSLEKQIKDLRCKYKSNFADKDFYNNIKENRSSQNSCPWTFEEYDKARENLFFEALQVRKSFIVNSQYVRHNLDVYKQYNTNMSSFYDKDRSTVFPHLLNSFSIIIPVLSSTFASVGRFLKYAGRKSLGMLIVDEAGQATPQSALGALYRTKRAIIVGDPLQIEPVVTTPQVLIDILADNTNISDAYKSSENSVQLFADRLNEFYGEIGDRQVGCPLIVHRRCLKPMFSISNIISYNNTMSYETVPPKQDKFLINKSGWINVKGIEKGEKNHFVKEQAEKACGLIKKAIEEDIYTLFTSESTSYDELFIITPFRTVSDELKAYVKKYFHDTYEYKILNKWVDECVGTVHTFQGKGAKEVLFVLGCSGKSTGAINWACSKANIVNVACTRAKYRIAFIGDLDNWKDKNLFRKFIPKFIDKI
ncbi:MAG: AAA domain-containing protein [Ruminococcus sp.]|nr:AAA domain-containing protein [Ruminococcus sp.]